MTTTWRKDQDDLISDLKNSLAAGLQSSTLTTCYRWATHRRIMGGDFSGNYSADNHPWVIEMHNSKAPFNYSMKGAQLGVTEVCINRAFFVLDVLKRDVLYVLPTAITAGDFSKARFGSALTLSPYIRSMFTDVNSVNLKHTGTNTLYIRGSRGDGNLISIPVGDLILDEVDRMDKHAVPMALQRLHGQKEDNIHVWAISTPTIPNKGIHKLFQETSQDHYVFECPSCHKWQHLSWPESIEICGTAVNDPDCHRSYLKCRYPTCAAKLPHELKRDWLDYRKAKWESFNKDISPKEFRGFHINQLYSFVRSPGKLVQDYFKGFGDEIQAQQFWNGSLGQPYIGSGARITDDMLDRAVRNHTMDDERPELGGQRIITMGVDQGKWNYVEIDEWTFPEYGRDLNAIAQCKVLYQGKFLDEHFHMRLDGLMREWQVLACVIDADPNRMDARRFARRFPGYVWLCQFRKGPAAKEIQMTEDIDGASVITVDRSHWLSAALGRFKTDPSRIVLPRDVTRDYRDHMKALVSIYEADENGNPHLEFASIVPDDHYAFARCYAELALPFVAVRATNENIEKFL